MTIVRTIRNRTSQLQRRYGLYRLRELPHNRKLLANLLRIKRNRGDYRKDFYSGEIAPTLVRWLKTQG
jgi:hypothetical protein